MEEQEGNMAPGQQNYPSNDESQGNSHALSGDEIREGANEEDQLDEFKKNPKSVDDNQKSGAAPDDQNESN